MKDHYSRSLAARRAARFPLRLLGALCSVLLLAGCGAQGSAKVEFHYTTPIIPVTFSIDSNWHVSVTLGAEITTPLGTFSIEGGAEVALAPDSTQVTIVLNKTGKEVVYELHGQGTLTLCLNGHLQETVSQSLVEVTPLNAPSQVDLLPGKSSCPSAAARPPGSVSPAAAPAPAVTTSAAAATYVDALPTAADSQPYNSQGVAQVNGVSYPHALGAGFCPDGDLTWIYVLGRKYTTLQGVIGLTDESPSTAVVRFEVLTDGQTVYSKDLQVGQSATLNIPIGNALQLELHSIAMNGDAKCNGAQAEWANVRAVG
jgi:hypothetical protein